MPINGVYYFLFIGLKEGKVIMPSYLKSLLFFFFKLALCFSNIINF